MSDVASLQLCRELYELSGWAGIYGPYADVTYNLDYLLINIPAVMNSQVLTLQPADHTPTTAWRIGYGDSMLEADTPGNAAAKLAIELLKQGFLPTNKDKDKT